MEKSFEEKVKRFFSLEKFNTMGLFSVADFFVEAKNKEDICNAIKFAKEKNISFFILGKGSNVLFPEKYHGVVIFITNTEIKKEEKKESVVFSVDAGASLPFFAQETVNSKTEGLEWAGGVPGSVGGAVRGNAGAFGNFIGDVITKVEALNTETMEVEIFQKKDCFFDYRESIFKKEKKYVILRVELEFPLGDGGKEKMKEYLDYRKERHPQEPSSGSVFKNPKINNDFYEKYPETKKFQQLGFVPVGYLIESCGLKGKTIGGAKVSEKHSNFIINTGRATQKDILDLISIIKEEVEKNFGVCLEEEVEVVKNKDI